MAKSTTEKSKAPKQPKTPKPPKNDNTAQADEAARLAEEERLRALDRDEEDERERQAIQERTREAQPAASPAARGEHDKTPVVIEYIGPPRAPFPVMFGDDLTWIGKDARDGLKQWQGRVERWYAQALIAREPGWWKVLKTAPPPPVASAKKQSDFPTTAWMSVRTLDDVEAWAKKIAPSTPPARVSYLRRMVQQFGLVQTEDQAAAIDEYVNMFPAVVRTPADQPRGARLVTQEDDADSLAAQQPPAGTALPPAGEGAGPGSAEPDDDDDEENFQ